jgi:Putative adhesin
MAIEKWVIAPGESRVIDLELVRKLKVSLIGGKVDVIAHDEPGARIEVSAVTGKDLKIEIDGDSLEIDHPQLRWDNFIDAFKGFVGNAKADVSILAPHHVALKLGVVSGDALVSGFTTDARLSTVSGDIVLDNHEGDVELSSVSGEISAGNHTGRITAHSVSGDVVATGDIVTFNADTVSGNMVVDARSTPDRIDTNTVAGDLTVRFAPGSGARYRVNTVGGTVLLDDATIKGMLGKGFERTVGELAGHWLDLGANSVSGNISVMRRTDADSHTTDAGTTDAAGTGAGTNEAGAPA